MLGGNYSHATLSRQFDISRERVRQIAIKINAPSGRELQKRFRSQREQLIQYQTKLRSDQTTSAAEKIRQAVINMWNHNVSIKYIAKTLGIKPTSAYVYVSRLRTKYPVKDRAKPGPMAASES